MKKVILIYVEKHTDGTYWGTTNNIPGVLSAYGSTLSELKENIKTAYQDYFELAVELKEDYLNELSNEPQFMYQLDLQNVFHLVPEIKITSIAKKAKMNASLLRQYKMGKVTASEEQSKKVLTAIHELGNELLSVSF